MNLRSRPWLALIASAVLLPIALALAQSSSYTNVRVVGPVVVTSDGGLGIIGTVTVNGTVALGAQTLADLTAPQCGQIFPLEKIHLDVDGGPHPIPPFLDDGGFGGDPNRSAVTIVNTDTVTARTMACDLQALDGGLPSCDTASGYGELLQNSGRFTWSVGQSRVIYCLPCNPSGVDLGFREENCR
jgi:hypothetical protein